MKNQIKDGVEVLTQDYTNSTGADLAAGNVVRVAGRFGILVTDVANGATGAAKIAGEFEFTKATGVTLAVGQPFGWDFANKRITTDVSAGVAGVTTVAAASGDTVVRGVLNGVNRTFKTVYTTTSTDDSNNYADIDTGFGVAAAGYCAAAVLSSAGVDRGSYTLTWTNGVARIAQANMGTGDKVHFEANLW